MNRHKYTKEEDQFLIDHVKGITLKELTIKFNAKFNVGISEESIQNRKHRLKLKSGIVGGQFKKGNIPMNKGKKWDEYMSKEGQENSRKTWFSSTDRSKQNANYNSRPLFSERINKDGYTLIKINEKGKFIPKHRWIYEQHHKCKIPKGNVIIFLDGNKRNLDINNLTMISQNQHKIMNKNNLRFDMAEATQSGINVAKLIESIQKKKGDIKNDNKGTEAKEHSARS